MLDQIDKIKSAWELQENILAHHVNPCSDSSQLEAGNLALICLSDHVGAGVRQLWYGFSQLTATKVFDFGNYVGNDLEPIHTLIHDLWAKDVIVVILSENLDKGLYHHFHDSLEEELKLSTHITRAPLDIYRLYPKVSFVSLANQIHRSKPPYLVKSSNLHTLRLGQMRSYFAESEPYIRHADCCFFDLNSIRFSDAPAQPRPSTSGLTSEEACHLSKYAGQAGRMKLFWIYNYHPEHDIRRTTADLVAQMLWYFVDGVEDRKDSIPVDTTSLQAYIVEFDRLDIPLTFYKSPVTDRWWVSGSIELNQDPIPCSLRDYESAKNGELTQRLLDLLHVYA